MSEPLRTQLFSTFLGVEEGIHSIILPDVFSSGGSLNMFLDKFGRTKRIDGYVKANAAAIATSGGGSAVAVRGLAHYRSTSGGTDTSQIISVLDDGVNEWEIWKSADSGITNSFAADLGATPVGINPDFAQFGDNLFITSGKVAPKKWNGTSISAAGDTQTVTPTATTSGTAGLLSGAYTYKLVARKNDLAHKPASLTSNQANATLKQIGLAWTADADTNTVGYEVYRTTGIGATFFWVDFVNGRTTVAYTDNIPDSTIIDNPILENHGDAPPTVYFVEPHKQRMWWGRSDTYPTRLWWSDPGLPESVYSYNYLEFSDSESQGDKLTGMHGNFGGSILVFTETGVWTVSGTGALIGNITDWNKQKSSAQIGCVSHRSVCRVPVGARYMDQQGQLRVTAAISVAYFTPFGDIRLFDGENDEVISHPLKDTLSGFNPAQGKKIHVLHDPAHAQFIWFFPTGDDDECSIAAVWNYRWGVWYKWSPLPMASSLTVVNDGSQNPYLLTGEASTLTGGFLYNFFVEDQDSFNGTAFPARWMTKTLYGRNQQGQPTPELRQTWRWADFLFKANDTTTGITVEWLSGNASDDAVGIGSADVFPTALSILTADGDSILSAGGDTLSIVATTNQAKVLLHDARGKYLNEEGIRLRVGNATATPTWALEAFTLAYQTHPGQQRRTQ